MGINLVVEAKNDRIKLDWLRMLPKDWENARIYKEQNNKV